MTKQELIDAIKAELADDMQTKHVHEKTVIDHVLNALGAVAAQELGRGGHVSLPRLGKLIANKVDAHTGRNPKTGAAVAIAAGYRVSFRAGKDLKSSLTGK